MTDLRQALRFLRKNPGFTLIALCALALGIGANTAIFSVIDTVLLHPLPYPGADRIVDISRQDSGGVSPPMFTFWQQNNPCFDDLTAAEPNFTNLNLTGGDRPELVPALRVSQTYFHLFGAHPILGRTFSVDEDRPGGPNVLVISYGLWQRRYAADSSVLGRAITLGGASYTVVGVLSPRFQPYPPADVFIPLQLDPNSTDQAHTLSVAGRLRDGTTLAQANALMAVVGKRYVQTHLEQLGNDDQLRVTPLQRRMTSYVLPLLSVLAGAVALVLLIACANVANLLLARAAGRHREIAVRAAIGAGRARIVRQLLTESALLAIGGGLLGLALASVGVRALVALGPSGLPRMEEMAAAPALNPWVALFAVLLSLFTAFLFGLFPALQVSRVDLVVSLKDSGGRTGSSLKQNRVRGALVAAEMAIAVVLLCGAVLLIRSFAALHELNPGFDTRNLLTVQVSFAGQKYATANAASQVARRAVQELEAIPGVQSAAIVSTKPLDEGIDMIFNIPGRPLPKNQKFAGDEMWRFVSSHYFQTMRIPLRAGRLFHDDEPSHTVVINEAMAKKFWAKTNPIGQSIDIGAGLPDYEEGAAEIIGVVGNVRENGLDVDPPPVFYQLYSQVPDGALKLVNSLLAPSLLIRTQPGVSPMSIAGAVKRTLSSAETALPPAKMQTMEQIAFDSTARQNFTLLLLGIFAAIALLLAALGVYGVMSYAVEQRTREIGVRAALGASRSDTLVLVLRQGFLLALIGVIAGLTAALGLTRLLASQLFGVKPSDPVTFAAVATILFTVALAATVIPALRASRIDPMLALRYE